MLMASQLDIYNASLLLHVRRTNLGIRKRLQTISIVLYEDRMTTKRSRSIIVACKYVLETCTTQSSVSSTVVMIWPALDHVVHGFRTSASHPCAAPPGDRSAGITIANKLGAPEQGSSFRPEWLVEPCMHVLIGGRIKGRM